GSLIDGAVEHSAQPLPAGLEIAIRDLLETPKRERLAQELKKSNAFHFDLTVRNTERAVERINHALKDQSITLLIDAAAKARLQKPEPQTQFVLYAENLQPEEVTAILQQLNQSKPKANDASFESLWLTAFTVEDEKQLAGLMGGKPEQFTPPEPGKADKLFGDTIIEKSPLRGGNDKKSEGNSKATRPHRYAVVLASSGDR